MPHLIRTNEPLLELRTSSQHKLIYGSMFSKILRSKDKSTYEKQYWTNDPLKLGIEWSGPSMIVHTGCNFVLQLFLLQYFKTDADATNEWYLGQKNSILRICMDKIQNMQFIYGDCYHMAHVVGNSNLMKINIEIAVTSQALGSN